MRRVRFGVLVVLATLGGVWAWGWYAEGRKGAVDFRVSDDLNRGGVRAEVEVTREGSGGRVAAFTSPTLEPLRLDPGDYRVRVSPERRLGQTFPVRVPAGSLGVFSMQLPSSPLFEIAYGLDDQIARDNSLAILLPGQSDRKDLLDIRNNRYRRYRGDTGRLLWDSRPPGEDGEILDEPILPAFEVSYGEAAGLPFPLPGWLWHGRSSPEPTSLPAPKMIDLDGDSEADAAWADLAKRTAMAYSGKAPKPLWTFDSTKTPTGKDKPAAMPTGVLAFEDGPGGGAVVVAAFQFDAAADAIQGKASGVVQAIDGKTGELRWSFTPTGGPAAKGEGILVVDQIKRGGREVVAVTFEDQIHFLDPKTGQPTEPALTFPGPTHRRPIFVEGPRDEVLVQTEGPQTLHYRAKGASGEAVSWQTPAPPNFHGSVRMMDLDGDGISEVLAPTWPASPGPPSSIELRLLDGRTGQVRWGVPFLTDTGPADRLVVLTDLDINGDGVRDLVLSALATHRGLEHLLVAVSGKDGSTLWVAPLPYEPDGDPLAWGTGPDGRPMIVAPLRRIGYSRKAATILLEARNGRECARVLDASLHRIDDLDGDGSPELWGVTSTGYVAFRDPRLPAWQRPGHWQVAADYDRDGILDLIGSDYAQEHVRDLLSIRNVDILNLTPSETAISGRDGHVLWTVHPPRVNLENEADDQTMQPLLGRPSDLDGDGAPDLLIHAHTVIRDPYSGRPSRGLPIAAISGKDGRVLWGPPAIRIGRPTHLEAVAHTTIDREGDGRAELAVLATERPPAAPGLPSRVAPTPPPGISLILIDGRDGNPIFRTELVPQGSPAPVTSNLVDLRGPIDFDGDRHPDLLVEQRWSSGEQVAPAERHDSRQLVGVSGRTGAILFRHPAPPRAISF